MISPYYHLCPSCGAQWLYLTCIADKKACACNEEPTGVSKMGCLECDPNFFQDPWVYVNETDDTEGVDGAWK